MKKIFLLISSMLICVLITACDSENVKKAKEAYEEEDYVAVVADLETEQDLSNDVEEMLNTSKAHVAYDEGDYNEALRNILMVENGKETDFYSSIVDSLIDKSVVTADADGLINANEMEPDIGEKAKETILSRCDELDYNAFKLLRRMVSKLDDGDLKTELKTYYEANKLNRPKAFLLGEWEWQSGDKKQTTVECIQHKDNLIGIIMTVGSNEKEYQIRKDDVEWKDFEFLSEKRFTCTSLCKTKSGLNIECTTVGTINYKRDNMHLHLTAPDPYWMSEKSAERDWERITDK